MKRSATIMGMPVYIIIYDQNVMDADFHTVFDYLIDVDNRFSTYKKNSEIEKINRGEIEEKNYSSEMKKILHFAEQTRHETQGYFDIHFNGKIDTSGIVKGYAIFQAAEILKKKGYENFSVEIAGDIQMYGKNEYNQKWKIGIQNPFQTSEIVKILHVTNKGVATSGTYKRGNHIYDPVHKRKADAIASITVIGPNIYEADRFATAAFAMGEKSICFIESLQGFEGYMITKDKRATYTSGFEKYI